MHGPSLPDDSAGSRRYTTKYRENCQEYTGVYGAGMFGSIGVIMPISLPITAATHRNRYA
ncbi:hypothetical protein [uncultured Megasphaera sp.]|uniref:hypothetical protein n=1 Tax=uncultured Megasphaera sp. TaxID=165188 RepID=UPI0026362D3A|nr:hypothetical protein [uncultured Megasphaera sp.]